MPGVGWRGLLQNHGGVGVESAGISRDRLVGDATAIFINRGPRIRNAEVYRKAER
jgi:hypothetical protein